MEPTAVYDTFWRFAAERQAVYYRRLTGGPPPWTDDLILARYRFTNAYRAADRVSQYLIGEVQYRADRSAVPAELFFRTILFKLWNRVETWEALERALGPLGTGTSLEAIAGVLDGMLLRGERVYSAAYIMPSPALGEARKHRNHLKLLGRMMEDRVAERARQAPSLRGVYGLLLGYPGLGPFLAFQYAIDLNYSALLDHDEGEFVVAGPGALDGIAKCFAHTGGRTAEAVIHTVCARQEDEFFAREIAFRTLWGRRLQPIDVQNLFCEIAKYARVAHPEVPGLGGRTRIKQVYRPAPPRGAAALPVFPPRWRLRVGAPAQI